MAIAVISVAGTNPAQAGSGQEISGPS